MKLYEEFQTFGPYKRKNDGRWILVLYNKTRTTSISYPKYKMEIHLGRYLAPYEEVHHKDENTDNNDLTNLEVKTIREHHKHHSIGSIYKDIEVECFHCNKKFIMTPRQQISRKSRRIINPAGPFCSFSCVGKYNRGRK